MNFECLLIEVTECFEEDDSGVDEVASFETVLDPLDNFLEFVEGKFRLFKVLYFSTFNLNYSYKLYFDLRLSLI